MSSGTVIWLICAYCRKEPMWFWSGTTVRREELSDVTAYNHANGIMWIVYALIQWVTAIVQFWSPKIAVTLLVVSCTVGLGTLMYAYHKIYQKYKRI